MADNPFSVQVVNPLQALMLGQQSYNTGIENNKKQAMEQARSEAGQLYAQGDTKGALARLLQGGDLQGAGTYSGLDQNDWTRRHTEAADAESKRRFGLTYGLQERQFAENQDYTPEELDQRRLTTLKANGIDPNSLEGRNYRISGTWNGPGSGNGPKYGVSPIYGSKTGPDGKEVPSMIQTSNTGEIIEPKLPDNFKIARDPIKIDSGTHWTLLDPQTRQPIGVQPKNVAEVERQKTLGDEGAKAEVVLPTTLANTEQILKHVEGLKSHPGKQYALGWGSKVPTIPNTSQADFRARLEQLGGENFLQASQNLRGLGAMTELEGTKAQNAVVRMQTAQTQKGFDDALDEYTGILRQAMQRAKNKAKLGTAAAGGGAAASPAGNVVNWQTYFGQ